jgi:hypothetical protein
VPKKARGRPPMKSLAKASDASPVAEQLKLDLENKTEEGASSKRLVKRLRRAMETPEKP